MNWYLLIKWLHIISSTVLLGTGAGIALYFVIDDDNCAFKDGTAPELDRKVKGLLVHSTCPPRAGWCHVEGRVARSGANLYHI